MGDTWLLALTFQERLVCLSSVTVQVWVICTKTYSIKSVLKLF